MGKGARRGRRSRASGADGGGLGIKRLWRFVEEEEDEEQEEEEMEPVEKEEEEEKAVEGEDYCFVCKDGGELRVCDFSFNATLMLEMLRGKRMLFVGDSLNHGQYVSLVCLLHRIIPESSKLMDTFDPLTVFKAKVFPLYRLV